MSIKTFVEWNFFLVPCRHYDYAGSRQSLITQRGRNYIRKGGIYSGKKNHEISWHSLERHVINVHGHFLVEKKLKTINLIDPEEICISLEQLNNWRNVVVWGKFFRFINFFQSCVTERQTTKLLTGKLPLQCIANDSYSII